MSNKPVSIVRYSAGEYVCLSAPSKWSVDGKTPSAWSESPDLTSDDHSICSYYALNSDKTLYLRWLNSCSLNECDFSEFSEYYDAGILAYPMHPDNGWFFRTLVKNNNSEYVPYSYMKVEYAPEENDYIDGGQCSCTVTGIYPFTGVKVFPAKSIRRYLPIMVGIAISGSSDFDGSDYGSLQLYAGTGLTSIYNKTLNLYYRIKIVEDVSEDTPMEEFDRPYIGTASCWISCGSITMSYTPPSGYKLNECRMLQFTITDLYGSAIYNKEKLCLKDMQVGNKFTLVQPTLSNPVFKLMCVAIISKT